MKRAIVILLAFGCLIETRGATNRVIQSIGETKYWMPDAAKLPDASILFGSDMQREVKAFGNMKNKLKPLVKKWAAVYLNQIKDTRSRTLYVGPFAENVLPVVIYDYEGASFWEVGNVKSFEDPVALPPVLVTKIHTFDFLLAGISDANSRAAQQFLIKWQVANCVIDGMRVEVTSDDIAKAHAEMWLTKSLNHELMLRDVEQHSAFQFFHNYVNVEQSFAYSLTALGFLNFDYFLYSSLGDKFFQRFVICNFFSN
jgi:hypothetical protein